MEQRTDEWMAQRAGKLTGSRFNALMAKTKSGAPSATRTNLLAAMAIERMNGTCVETYQNAAMLRGIELEPFARQAYEESQFVTVEEIAFIVHPELDFVGVSPDGLVGSDGMVEIKCPSAENKHLQAILKGQHCVEYKWQMQGQLWVAEREWLDAVSYDPRWPSDFQLAIKRIYRDEKAISELEAECIASNEQINEIISKVKEAA